jgi:hypothetical protein
MHGKRDAKPGEVGGAMVAQAVAVAQNVAQNVVNQAR